MRHTLLLADDSVTIQRVIELTFADENIDVIAVGDGDRAIAVLESARPDIVLADVEMPGRNGYEVAEHIRVTPALAHIRVLLLTGASEPIDHDRASAVACDGVLAKPFEPQQVIAMVRELLAAPKKAAVDFHTTQAAVPANAPTPEPSGNHSASVDEYLMRLDQALSGLSDGHAVLQRERPAKPERLLQTPSPPASGTPTRGLPSLDAAFAALLAAERTGALPAADVSAAPLPPESLVEEVTARVLNRLAAAMEPAMVTDVMTRVAERLIREEIERIKSSLDSISSD